jgi:hypothetical protein
VASFFELFFQTLLSEHCLFSSGSKIHIQLLDQPFWTPTNEEGCLDTLISVLSSILIRLWRGFVPTEISECISEPARIIF